MRYQKQTAVVSSPLIEHNSSWMLPAPETNTHLTSHLFSFFEHIHSADLHLPKVTRAWFLKRIKAHSMTALEGHSGHFKSHQSYRAAAWRRPCNNTASSAVSSSKKTCFYLPLRRHDFGSLVEGDTLWAGVAFCLQMRWSMDFVSPCYFFGFCDMMIGPGRDFKLKDISIVMSLSLHCQNCKKCRRRCRDIAATLPPHCRHIAATSPPQLPQDLISANKVLFWPNRTLLAEIRSCGSCGGEVAAMWRQCGGNVAATWRQCGGNVAATWRQCAATLPPPRPATAATGPYFCQ